MQNDELLNFSYITEPILVRLSLKNTSFYKKALLSLYHPIFLETVEKVCYNLTKKISIACIGYCYLNYIYILLIPPRYDFQLNFIGVATQLSPVLFINGEARVPQKGDIVLYNIENKTYLYTGTSWLQLGSPTKRTLTVKDISLITSVAASLFVDYFFKRTNIWVNNFFENWHNSEEDVAIEENLENITDALAFFQFDSFSYDLLKSLNFKLNNLQHDLKFKTDQENSICKEAYWGYFEIKDENNSVRTISSKLSPEEALPLAITAWGLV